MSEEFVSTDAGEYCLHQREDGTFVVHLPNGIPMEFWSEAEARAFIGRNAAELHVDHDPPRP